MYHLTKTTTMKYINTDIQISEAQKINTQALNQYVQGIMCMNPKMIEEVLHDRGVFHGKCKLAQSAWLKELFHNMVVGNMITYHLNKGIAVFPLSGSEVTELRIQCVKSMEEFGAKQPFGTPAGELEHVLTFIAEFKDGKIFRLVRPKKAIGAESVASFEQLN